MATSIPVTWTEDDYNWKIKLPGEGHSHPVMWKGKILITSAPKDGSKRFVTCYDESGKQHGRWVWWHQNGLKAIVGDYKNGVPINQWIWWKDSGRVALKWS